MELTGEPLSLTQIAQVAIGGAKVSIAASAHARSHASRGVIEEILKSDAVVYGINTGFGRLADVQIERGRRSFQRFERHCAGDIRNARQPLRSQQRQSADCMHTLRAVQ